jgi:hypothetical protein
VILHRVFLDEEMGCQKFKAELHETLGAKASGLSQIKVWLARFKEGDVFYEDHSRLGGPMKI